MGFEVYLLTLYIYFVKCNNLFTPISSEPQVSLKLRQSLAHEPFLCLLSSANLSLHFVERGAVKSVSGVRHALFKIGDLGLMRLHLPRVGSIFIDAGLHEVTLLSLLANQEATHAKRELLVHFVSHLLPVV